MGKKSKHRKRGRSSSSERYSESKHTKREIKSEKSYKYHNDYEEKRYNRDSKSYRDSEPSTSRKAENEGSEFTFLDYKSDLNKIIYTEKEEDKLVLDRNDFWQFVSKYETVLKKSGKPILQKDVDKFELNNIGLPTEHSKLHSVNIKLRVSWEELYGKIPPYDEEYDGDRKRLTKKIVKQFVDILLLYADFKNKEKFNKLKKLRKTQSELPVAEYRDRIVESVKNERVVIIAGDTGCGKSTQVPQYLSEAGFKCIACTQPRRIACISLAKRVSFESLSQFGSEVGYQIRFEKSRNQGTKICFITEGLLLRQIASESVLSIYDVIILDEIHERHLHGDFLLGILKCLIQSRDDLKLVLMSATINIKLFSDYFENENAVVIEVPGRLYPIELFYRPMLVEGRVSKSERLDPQPYLQIMQIIDTKFSKEEKGDLLIFLSGLQEITSVVDAANQYAEKNKRWIVLPLHSSMSIADQDKVFDYPPDGVRKCIVSTNIAETSVTIDGIRFVVDSGKVKEMSYDPSCKMQRLKEFWIPKSSAEQRKGRAGRTGPGICYRIYSEKDYESLESFGTPELLRVPLDSLLLLMISLGLNDVRKFPFLDAPQSENIENALVELKQHYAITSNERLTSLGKALSRLPVELVLGKMLILGSVLLQSETTLSLAAALSVQSPYTNRAHRDPDCEAARKPLESDHGDPLILLNTYAAWLEVKQEWVYSKSYYDKNKDNSNSGGSRQWCKKRGLEEQRFYEITKLRTQFKDLLQDCGLLESIQPETMSSADRALRHGQLKQLKDLRKQHRNQSIEDSRKRKKLKLQLWEIDDEFNESNSDVIDIKDVEFRLNNDMRKVQDLISGSSAKNQRDLATLKLILCRALYPQIAIADEFNHCKSVSEQLFHTSSKAFVSLHPMSYFGSHPQVLQMDGDDIDTGSSGYSSKLPLSSKHQILCYLSLLETTKPYLMNTMRMPAVQTLLLFAHCIDTNLSFSRLVCDSWLQFEFPTPEVGLQLLFKASQLRKQWDNLINERLEDVNVPNTEENVESKPKVKFDKDLQYDLSAKLAEYMTTNVSYTIKRLLPADLKKIYNTIDENVCSEIDPNPFDGEFKCFAHEQKGGVWLTDHIVFGSLVETSWSDDLYQQISQTPWNCQQCKMTMCLPPLEKLQHKYFTCSQKETKEKNKTEDDVEKSSNPNTREYKCDKCDKKMYLTPIEILKHKKNCQILK